MAFSSARIEPKRPRLSWRAVRMENQHSTKLSQEADVGVKCKRTRGCRSSQRWMVGLLWVLARVHESQATSLCGAHVSAGPHQTVTGTPVRNESTAARARSPRK